MIVPICWGFKPFTNFLSNLVELPVIGEVILIDNNNTLAPKHKILEHSKIKHHVMQENIFVNPAWNMGADIAEHDILYILSDDILIDLRVFLEADKFVTKEIGVLGIEIKFDYFNALNNNFDKIENVENLIVSGDVSINEFGVYGTPVGGGTIFFIHKQNWIKIPDPFKIYYGDNWIYNTQKFVGRKNYKMMNAFFNTPWFVASKIGMGAEYQQSDEYWKNENLENFKNLQIAFIQENNLEIPDYLLNDDSAKTNSE